MEALIVYHTISGHTRRAAEDIAEGLRSEGVSACLRAAAEMREWDLAGQAIVVVGSPCHAGSLSIRAGLSGPIRSVLKKLPASALVGKAGGAFSVHSPCHGAEKVRAIKKYLRAAVVAVPHPGVVIPGRRALQRGYGPPGPPKRHDRNCGHLAVRWSGPH
jgi:menaquinone-dependent protoporphyrinogen IX oxidase